MRKLVVALVLAACQPHNAELERKVDALAVQLQRAQHDFDQLRRAFENMQATRTAAQGTTGGSLDRKIDELDKKIDKLTAAPPPPSIPHRPMRVEPDRTKTYALAAP